MIPPPPGIYLLLACLKDENPCGPPRGAQFLMFNTEVSKMGDIQALHCLPCNCKFIIVLLLMMNL